MSSGEDRKAPHEIVLVRRRKGGHGDGHHGGAWKIAFADFMTALMCFFLVMWLINATDKKTLTQVATYFNPLRLNDRLPTVKGLHDPGPQDRRADKSEAKDTSEESTSKADEKSPSKDKKVKKDKKSKKNSEATADTHADVASRDKVTSDQELLRDPYTALDRIASGGDGDEKHLGRGAMSDQGLPLDSFDPAARRRLTPEAWNSSAKNAAELPPSAAEAKPADATAPSVEAGRSNARSDRAVVELNAQQIEKKLLGTMGDLPPGKRPHIEVQDLKLEILISLTDDFDFGMFALSSASPTRELITVMERIAKVLEPTTGAITIRGHTDGRRFRTPDNDNWRLSMARAQIAFYMLTRGGLPEMRIRRLEGHADHSLKVSGDPLAARNRRIDILIARDEK